MLKKTAKQLVPVRNKCHERGSEMKEIYEKAGLFYLGRDVDKDSFESGEELTLLKNKNFTTHAAIIGMTGSGKTGLGIGIIEEAAIDNIPAIVIDPKGDMGDLCLTDPEFKIESFLRWVEDDARAKGVDPEQLAQETAQTWEDGIVGWGQDRERVERFHSVEKTIYTPGSRSGIPVNLMSSLELPQDSIIEDGDNFAAYLKSTVTGLLSLIGIEADPLDSKEYILLAQIISKAWMAGESLGIETLVGRILNPDFDKVGVLPLEGFYPEKERFAFATKFNAVIASPSFVNWLSGESLDIQKLLYDENGKAKISIFSISHLGDDERMFFVTLLLNKFVAWMRMQSGSNRLRALLYMDEIYGFFPPVKNPPSKEPMITLLKQARAFGIGVVLSTQNPVDLDYKGLSNIGTWFIGRLQTAQDIDRVISGLEGKADSSFDKKEIENLLANLKKRVFFLKSAHLDDIRLFGTRWVMSYLKGPLKKDEIKELMRNKKETGESTDNLSSAISSPSKDGYGTAVVLDRSISQRFEPDPGSENRYTPYLAAKVEVGYHDQRRGIDSVEKKLYWLCLDGIDSADWEISSVEDTDFERWPAKAPSGSSFKSLPPFVSEDRYLKKSSAALKDYIYQESRLVLYRNRKLKLESKPGESEADFNVKVKDILEEKKEEELEKLKDRYESKEKRLLDQLKRAQERVEKEKADQTSSIIGAGISILGAMFGRTTASKIGSAVNRGSRVLKEHGDISRAQQRVMDIEEKIQELADEMEEKIDILDEKFSLDNYPSESFSLRPKKSDIDIEDIVVAWRIG